MKKSIQTEAAVRLAVAVIFFAGIFSLGGPAVAELTELPGMAYKVNASMADNLRALVGKKVNLTLASGNTFNGVVKAVGKGLVHLEKLEGKEYFDALIRLEEISAIDARFRDYQR